MLPDWETTSHFHFLRPWFALFLIPWACLLYLQNHNRANREMFGGIIAPHLLKHLRLKPLSAGVFNPRNTATAFALIVLVVLMGPSWRQQPSPLHEDETALLILLDMSSSMEQTDIQPSRVQRSKQKIADLLAMRPGKKAALIAYAGSAHTVLSLTSDSDILNQYLSATTTSIMPRPGKFPEYALHNVAQVLGENTAPATVLLFTDGLGADSTRKFASFFRQHHHQLIVVGAGTKTTAEDAIPLEQRRLEALADKTGGHYLELTIDHSDITQINRRIDSHYIVLEDSALPWQDAGYWLLYPAILLFVLWFRKGWTLSTSALALPAALQLILLVNLMLPATQTLANEESPAASDPTTRIQIARDWFASLWLTPNQHGRLLFQLQEYTAAAQRFENPLWKGLSYYYAEEFMLAAEYFSRSDTPDSLFNEANARAHARDYVRAVARYDALLEQAPRYPGAQENRDAVQAIIDEINRLSESQRQEAGVGSEEKMPGSKDNIPAQGADEIAWKQQQQKQLTAEELLADKELTQLWLRGVSHDPSSFLAAKFSMQLNREKGSRDKE